MLCIILSFVAEHFTVHVYHNIIFIVLSTFVYVEIMTLYIYLTYREPLVKFSVIWLTFERNSFTVDVHQIIAKLSILVMYMYVRAHSRN